MNRPDLNKLKERIEAGQVDVLVCKDLSRLSRHNAQALLFLEYLEEHSIRVLLKGDNYDSACDDGATLGITAWYNERYVKDISQKISMGMRQLQKQGMVIIEHFGYRKNPDDKHKLLIDEGPAQTVRLIFSLYLRGMGAPAIAKYLNERGIMTPSVYKQEVQGFGWKPSWKYKHLWQASCVTRILKNDAYIGTLRCGVTRVKKIKGHTEHVDKSQHYVHEDFMEPIVSKEDFMLVQSIFATRAQNSTIVGKENSHRYSGLLRCAECGQGFCARLRTTRSEPRRVAYYCSTYNRYGDPCTAHLIFEKELDDCIFTKLADILSSGRLHLAQIESSVERRRVTRDQYTVQLARINAELEGKRTEIKEYARQHAQQRIDNELYDELTREAMATLNGLKRRFDEVKAQIQYLDGEPSIIRKYLERLDEILRQRELNNADITMLIERIQVSEGEESLSLDIVWKVEFMDDLESALKQAPAPVAERGVEG